MKNPFSIISADDKKEKDKVSMVDTLSEPETGSHDNVTTPVNNQGDNGNGRRDGMTPYIEMLTEDDLQPTPPEEYSLGDKTRDKGNDPPLSQEET
eukprot:2897074-Ditylum_brightwellii.AAC.1